METKVKGKDLKEIIRDFHIENKVIKKFFEIVKKKKKQNCNVIYNITKSIYNQEDYPDEGNPMISTIIAKPNKILRNNFNPKKVDSVLVYSHEIKSEFLQQLTPTLVSYELTEPINIKAYEEGIYTKATIGGMPVPPSEFKRLKKLDNIWRIWEGYRLSGIEREINSPVHKEALRYLSDLLNSYKI